LFRLIFLGIFVQKLLEQTRRKAGTQNHRSKARSHDSGVASICRQIQAKQGDVRGVGAHAS